MSAVPMPIATASTDARQWCARSRLSTPGYPLRVAVARRDLAVERHRRLEQDPGAAGAGVLAEGLVEQPRAVRELAVGDDDLDALVAEDPEAAPGRLLVGSSLATTTRRIPAARIASVQGGVRPDGSRARARRRASPR